MDYWNLRAIGWDIIPIPKQFAQYDNTKQCALDFIEANHVPHDSNPEIYHHTAILRSRSISEDEQENFIDTLDVPKPDEPSKRPKVVIHRAYPRMWDEWARHYDRVECCNLEARTAEHDISPDQDIIRFKTLDPKCIGRFAGYSEVRFANEIDLRLYDDKELLAEVIPEGSWELARVISFDAFDWRLSRKGLVYLSRHRKWEISLTLPQAEAVVTKWLNLRGWKVALSPAGRIAKQMIRQLGGRFGTWTLAKKGIIHLLEEMNSSDGKSISESHLHGTIAKIANQTDSKRMAKIIFQQLIERDVFQLGMEIQCPVCTESSWYSVKSVDYQLQCPKCLAQFSFPSVSKNIKWSYRTLGPFSLPKQAYGAYAVLLTLRFFSTPRLLDGATTPLMSFTTRKGRMKELEADFALFFQASKFGDSKTQLIFAECKTYNAFRKKDTHRMQQLGEAFPGAVLVFATLKECVSQLERDVLKPLVIRSRMHWKAGRPFNPVMVLTGKELFLESVWDSHLKDTMWQEDLLELCDDTQRINLGMVSRHQWLDEQTGRITSVHRATWTTPDGEIVRSAN